LVALAIDCSIGIVALATTGHYKSISELECSLFEIGNDLTATDVGMWDSEVLGSGCDDRARLDEWSRGCGDKSRRKESEERD
jgi:hypothetical protein